MCLALETCHALHGCPPGRHLHDHERCASRRRRFWPRKRSKSVRIVVRPYAVRRLAHLDPRKHDHRTDVPFRGDASPRRPRADLRLGPPDARIARGASDRGLHPPIPEPGTHPAHRDSAEHGLGVRRAVPDQRTAVPRCGGEHARLARRGDVEHAWQRYGRPHHLSSVFVRRHRLHRHGAAKRKGLASGLAPAVHPRRPDTVARRLRSHRRRPRSARQLAQSAGLQPPWRLSSFCFAEGEIRIDRVEVGSSNALRHDANYDTPFSPLDQSFLLPNRRVADALCRTVSLYRTFYCLSFLSFYTPKPDG